MKPLLSFWQRKPETPGEDSPPESLAAAPIPPPTIEPTATPMSLAIASSSPLNMAIQEMSGILEWLKGVLLPHPEDSVYMVSMNERPIGLGNYLGIAPASSLKTFPVMTLKGLRLDVLIRFQLLAATAGGAETVMSELNKTLFQLWSNSPSDLNSSDLDKQKLFRERFLRLVLETSPPATHVASANTWLKTSDYRVLYEFQYQDTDDAKSLIVRIPIDIDSEVYGFSAQRESTVVTDEMVRWDDESAPTLVVRGPFNVGHLSALVFIPGTPPSGAVSIMRTFDGATGSPVIYPTLEDFVAAVTGPAPVRHAQANVSIKDFLAAFTSAGDPVTLGDWHEDGVPDSYAAQVYELSPVLQLRNVTDRLEIGYQDTAFDQVAVVYLRVRRG